MICIFVVVKFICFVWLSNYLSLGITRDSKDLTLTIFKGQSKEDLGEAGLEVFVIVGRGPALCQTFYGGLDATPYQQG
jgi:hypothetical protein